MLVRWVRAALGVLFLLVGSVGFVLGLVGALSGIGGYAVAWFFVGAIVLGAVGVLLAGRWPGSHGGAQAGQRRN
jgi:hypothetical protein